MAESSGLECRGLVIERTGSRIVTDLDLLAPAGEVTVVLGANGAGKTTLMEGISGLIPIQGGRLGVGGKDVTKLSRVSRSRHGLSHVEQGRPVFAQMTVEENLLVAAKRRELARALEVFPEMEKLLNRRAGLLSGGEQQMLVIARAMLRRPRVLMLDEMSLGLAPVIVRRLIPRVRQVADEGTAVVLVEQFAQLALSVGTTAYVLAKGTVRYCGPAAKLLDDEAVLRAAYLGEGQEVAQAQ